MAESSRNINRGEFYTPPHIVKLLHDYTDKYINNFERTHLVWDNCWGTGNLTEKYEFNNLFCSTIQNIDIRKNKHKNENAYKFQYDFLNKDTEMLVSEQAMWIGETTLPEQLDSKLRSKDGGPILFYINPPYVATGIYGTNNTNTKAGQTSNRMKEIMQEHKMQSACDQAYAQFLYKILLMKRAYENKDISIAVICPPLFLSANTYKNFREAFLKEFKFLGGALFKASNFEGLSDRWAISIQIWGTGETEDKKNFLFDLYDTVNGRFTCIGKKKIYNLDNERVCMDWAKDELRNEDLVLADYTLSSGCKISNKKDVYWDRNSLGYMFYKGNNIYHNEQEVGIMSLCYSDGSGYSIIEKNFDKTMAIYCARRCFSRYGADWVNDKDEYCIPNTESLAYKTLVENSMIYALFNGSMHASSLFITDDYGNKISVVNNFHHISCERTTELFNRHNVQIVGPGEFTDRIMVEKVNNAVKSGLVLKEGIELLHAYDEIFEMTLKKRGEYNLLNPQYQVINWDCGYYQLKWVLKEYWPDTFRQFQAMYKNFEDALRPLIHQCGFLR